ncbi:MAG: CRTAC1 family protein [Flavobacteriales bacterium]|nr:CRTAC1 family protein [Flavobacteriales bacterium]
MRSIRVLYNDVCNVNISDALQSSSLLAGPFAVGVDPIFSCIDYDNDHDVDLLVVMQGTNNGWPGTGYFYQPVGLFRNDGGVFTDVSNATGIGLGHSSGPTIWDYNNDGFLDFTYGTGDCCDNPNVARTYRNNGDGTFTDVTSAVLKSGNHYFFGAMTADIDNDCDNDIYWWQGAWTTSQLFVNNGSSFTGNAAASYGLNLSGGQDQNGAPGGIRPSWFDADDDGDLDVLCGVGGNGAAKLMINPLLPSAATNARYLTIDLEGCSSGRSAINAVVKVYRAGIVTAQLSSSTLQGGLLRSRYHFGMGSSAVADSVVVLWPLRSTTRSYQVAADQILADPGGSRMHVRELHRRCHWYPVIAQNRFGRRAPIRHQLDGR